MNLLELQEALTGNAPRRVHLIGVAGSGMSGIAALLLALSCNCRAACARLIAS